MSNDDILGLRNSTSSFEIEKDILNNKSPKHYQCHITLFSFLEGDFKEKTEILRSVKEIFEVSVYYFMIYRWVN